MNTSISWINEAAFGEGGVRGDGVLDNRDVIADVPKVGVADAWAVMNESEDVGGEVDFWWRLAVWEGPSFKPRSLAWEVDCLAPVAMN
jgi:hypothetical protein